MDSGGRRRHLVVQNPIILHDNARSHIAAVTDLLRRWQSKILEHPPYSPDMSPYDYDLFVDPLVQWLSYSPLDPRFAAEVDGFFMRVNILSKTFFGREVKALVPCR